MHRYSRFIASVLTACLLLIGCTSENSLPTPTPTPTRTPKPSLPVFDTGHKYLDYSNHDFPREEEYITLLNDLELVSAGKPVIARIEKKQNYWFENGPSLEMTERGIELRGFDISEIDLSVIDDYNKLRFDTRTVWPEVLPQGFDPERAIELGKTPALGIRDIHAQGITGKDVNIAIIDQNLIADHIEYKDKLMWYECIHLSGDEGHFHGSAVSAFAAGKNLGTAPGAQIYFIGAMGAHFLEAGGYEEDYTVWADSVRRVIEINAELPNDDKIRVISMSKGFDESIKGYDDIMAAIRDAQKEGIFVISTSIYKNYPNLELNGMGRDLMSDPEDINVYRPAAWVTQRFYSPQQNSYFDNIIWLPMGGRSYAAATGTDVYEIEGEGGMSWSMPWLAGLYALCCEVKPEITPDEFISLVQKTAVSNEFEFEGQTYGLKKIINPKGIIEALKQQ